MTPTSLEGYLRDHTWLIARAAELLAATDVVAFEPDEFADPFLKVATRGPVRPLDGALIRDWNRDNRMRPRPGSSLGTAPIQITRTRTHPAPETPLSRRPGKNPRRPRTRPQPRVSMPRPRATGGTRVGGFAEIRVTSGRTSVIDDGLPVMPQGVEH